MNGMLSPLPMPVNQTLVPTGGYGTGTNYIPIGARLLTPSGGYATQPMMMPQITQMPPQTGMFGLSNAELANLLYNPAMGDSGYEAPQNTPGFTPSPFARDLMQAMYNMPFSPIMNLLGGLGLRGYNRASLASVTGDNFSSSGPTDSFLGGRDTDGWGE